MTNVLRERRRDQALTLEELAKKANVGYATVSRLELGKTKAQPKTVRKLAKALKIEPRELRPIMQGGVGKVEAR